ncbi:MAG: P63C domain-containing protein [Geminicoccaceae bacterium]
MDEDSPQRQGGLARARKLTLEARKEIATRAAQARWGTLLEEEGRSLPKAIASGDLRVGNVTIPCAVLDDEENTRVFTQDGFLESIGRSKRPNTSDKTMLEGMPAFLRATGLKPFIDKNLTCSSNPISFHPLRTGGHKGIALGYKAELLPEVCWIYHDAASAGKLRPNQLHIAAQCDVLLRALTNVAIDALVDEATGFQDIRAKDALVRLLEKYVSKEALPWVKTFDDDFYKELFRLHGYKYEPGSVKRPMIFARRTEDVYSRLAPGVREELQRIVKRGKSGRPSEKLFQHLTESKGYQELRDLLSSVKTIMKLSTSIKDYRHKLDRVHPRFGETIQLPFVEDEI